MYPIVQSTSVTASGASAAHQVAHEYIHVGALAAHEAEKYVAAAAAAARQLQPPYLHDRGARRAAATVRAVAPRLPGGYPLLQGAHKALPRGLQVLVCQKGLTSFTRLCVGVLSVFAQLGRAHGLAALNIVPPTPGEHPRLWSAQAPRARGPLLLCRPTNTTLVLRRHALLYSQGLEPVRPAVLAADHPAWLVMNGPTSAVAWQAKTASGSSATKTPVSSTRCVHTIYVDCRGAMLLTLRLLAWQ